MPLNIDWQQILLHWMNLAILTGGLYFILYKPVKQFINKREEHYRDLEQKTAEKLAQATQAHAEYQAKMSEADEEIREARAKAQQSAQQSVKDQLAQAKEQAQRIVDLAHEEAEHSRELILKESQRELKELAAKAAKKLAVHPDADPFDQFLNLAEGGKSDESR